MLAYGNELVAKIDACPKSYSLREVLRETVFRVAQRGVARQLRTRKHLEILNKSAAAAAAEMSRFLEVQALGCPGICEAAFPRSRTRAHRRGDGRSDSATHGCGGPLVSRAGRVGCFGHHGTTACQSRRHVLQRR